MALENRVQKANRLAKEALIDIVKATRDNSFLYTPAEIHDVLLKKGLVEINKEIVDGNGNIATRATEMGLEAVPQQEGVMVMSEGNTHVSLATSFEIEDIPVVVESKRGGGPGKVSIYPFDSLEVGQSFFVPATEKMPEPWKAMTGSISAANRKYSVPATNADGSPKMRKNNKGDMIQARALVRQFVVMQDTKGDVSGARVGRKK